MARILSVSYDQPLLIKRATLLEGEGYDVVSVQGFVESLEQCKQSGFDLWILGHSVPHKDKQELVKAFRQSCSAPVISLLKNSEAPLDAADFHIEPDPRKLLQLVGEILLL